MVCKSNTRCMAQLLLVSVLVALLLQQSAAATAPATPTATITAVTSTATDTQLSDERVVFQTKWGDIEFAFLPHVSCKLECSCDPDCVRVDCCQWNREAQQARHLCTGSRVKQCSSSFLVQPWFLSDSELRPSAALLRASHSLKMQLVQSYVMHVVQTSAFNSCAISCGGPEWLQGEPFAVHLGLHPGSRCCSHHRGPATCNPYEPLLTRRCLPQAQQCRSISRQSSVHAVRLILGLACQDQTRYCCYGSAEVVCCACAVLCCAVLFCAAGCASHRTAYLQAGRSRRVHRQPHIQVRAGSIQHAADLQLPAQLPAAVCTTGSAEGLAGSTHCQYGDGRCKHTAHLPPT